MGTTTEPTAPRTGPPGLADWPAFLYYKSGWVMLELGEEALQTVGLRFRHYMVLTMLQAGQELSQQDMAEAMSLDATLMVGLIDDLEQWGFVERRRNPEDRRRYVVLLTRKGRAKWKEAKAIIDREEDAFFAPLSPEQRALLGDIASRLMAPHWSSRAPCKD